MIPIYDFDQVSPEEIFSRETDRADVSGAVAAIIADVRQNGDSALLRYAREFDHAELTAVEVPREAMEAAALGLGSGLRAVLRRPPPTSGTSTAARGGRASWSARRTA